MLEERGPVVLATPGRALQCLQPQAGPRGICDPRAGPVVTVTLGQALHLL